MIQDAGLEGTSYLIYQALVMEKWAGSPPCTYKAIKFFEGGFPVGDLPGQN